MRLFAMIAAVLVNCVMGSVFAAVVGVDPMVGAVGMNVVAATVGGAGVPAGSLRAGVYTEIWTGELVKYLRRGLEATWLDGIPDSSSIVNNDVIHLVEVGVDPDVLVNSYPTYFEKLPPLIAKINREKRNSKNYVLFLGETGAESNQAPCLSLVQFQIDDGELVLSAYQRSSDANLGLPADIYHLYLMARQIDLPLKSITLNLGNVHIYENNQERTRQLLDGDENVKFDLNV